jgi:hypothetical protein
MIQVENITYYANCPIEAGRKGFYVLESMAKEGIIPIISLKNLWSKKTMDKLGLYMDRADIRKIKIDIGTITCDDKYSSSSIDFIIGLRKKYGTMISNGVLANLGRVIRPEASEGINSCISLDEYIDKYEKLTNTLRNIDRKAGEYGICIELKNTPMLECRNEYSETKSPNFRGAFFTSSREIIRTMKAAAGTKLAFDLKSLERNIGWSSIYNLENSDDGRLRYKQLTEEQKKFMKSRGVMYDSQGKPFSDESIVFDYSRQTKEQQANGKDLDSPKEMPYLSPTETNFIKNHGFVFRKGQPAVYMKKLTQFSEIRNLFWKNNLVTASYASITPGILEYNESTEIETQKNLYNHMHYSLKNLYAYLHDMFKKNAVTEAYFRPDFGAGPEKNVYEMHGSCLRLMGHIHLKNVIVEPSSEAREKKDYKKYAAGLIKEKKIMEDNFRHYDTHSTKTLHLIF